MKTACKISYHGFWNVSSSEFLELPFIKALPTDKVAITNWFSKIKYYSVMSNELFNTKKRNNKKIVFFTGEDVEYNYPQFRDYCLNKTDLSLGFEYEYNLGNPSNYLRYPLWLCYFFPFTLDKDEIKKQLDVFCQQRSEREKKFCLVASHDWNNIRKALLNIICSVGYKVNCAGAFMHNDDELKLKFSDNKVSYLRNFIFNICPENVSSSGYTTEKVFESILSGCIPIYYGSLNVPEKDVLNQNAIIIWNGKNDAEVLDKIKEICTSSSYRNEFRKQNPFVDTAVDYIYERHFLLRQKYKEMFRIS